MKGTIAQSLARGLACLAAAALLAACDSPRTTGPTPDEPNAVLLGDVQNSPFALHDAIARMHRTSKKQVLSKRDLLAKLKALVTLRIMTARYNNVDAAIKDGFILLHGCETRPGEGAVGVLYVHLDRFMDGIIDPTKPDGLLYAPDRNGKLSLAGVELAVPASGWNSPKPPQFLGVPFQTEEEFDAYGLHIWVWKYNPDGLFAQAHPAIACEAEP